MPLIPTFSQTLISNLPNALSSLRLFFAIAFPFAFKNHYINISLIFIILGAISDFFDGYLARRLAVESEFGALLDPLMDKIFAGSVLWTLCLYQRPICASFLWMTILLSIRDFILILGSLFVIFRGIKIDLSPIFLSKVCTTLVFSLCVFVMLWPESRFLPIISNSCLALISLTGLIYLIRYLRNI